MMTSENKINTEFLKHMRREIADALTKVGDANEMTISIGNITYSNTGFKTKVTAEVGNAEDAERAAFEKATIHFFGEVTPEMYGMKFTNGRDAIEYTLIGLNYKAPKWPVLGRNAAGDTYKFKLSVISREKQTPRIRR